MEASKRIHIGTSGWHYEHWQGPFYPPDVHKEGFLTYYARYFHTVEINNSFYRLPEKKTFSMWRDSVPGSFLFSVKASRFITHMKKLKEPEKALTVFIERASFLGGKLGPILFQLPPNWGPNIDRLRAFLRVLPGDYRYAFEFRDPRWFDPEVYEALKEYNAAFCIFEIAGLQSTKEITADFTYIRLHGPEAAYSGRYSTPALTEWAQLLCSWSQQGIESYCYFDNDELGYAVQNARELQELVGTLCSS